jgi:hypothetical protein
MLLTSDYLTPQELTGYVREALANLEINQFNLSRFLPTKPIDDLEYRYTQGGEGLVDAATFRAYDAESPIGKRPGATRVSGELPPISRKIRFGEYDRLRARKAGSDQFVAGILGDAERMARAIAARFELARGDALVNGSITLAENGLVATVSYGRSGSHSVSAGTVWSNAAADIIADLMTWQATYVATNGVKPGRLVGSTAIQGYLLKNTAIRAYVGSLAGSPAMVTVDQAQSVLAAFGLPPFETYDVQVNVNGAATRVVAADKLLMLPAPANGPDGTELGATLLGTTAESLEPGYGLSGVEAGIVAGSYRTEDPIAIWTKAAAIGLPVMVNPNLSFVADVA